MHEQFDPVADARTPARHAARASIVAPMTAMLVSLLTSQLMGDGAGEGVALINFIGGTVASLLILAGVLLGVVGIIGGLRRRSHDTTMIAGLGLFFSGGYLLLSIWLIIFLRGQ
jgi:hypothetical protein